MIVVDVETTGRNPRRHSIISIGAIDFDDPNREFYEECRIWNGAAIERKALEVNGFTEDNIRDPNKKTLEKIFKEFLEWTEFSDDRTLAGHNVGFDRDFLNASAMRYGIYWPFGYRTVDLHTLCYAHFLRRNIKPVINSNTKRTDINLDFVLSYVGLNLRRDIHNALEDAKLEAEAFSRLIKGGSLLEEYKKHPIPSYLLLKQ